MVYEKTIISINLLITFFYIWLFLSSPELWTLAIVLIWITNFFGFLTFEDWLIKLVIFFRYHLEDKNVKKKFR